MRPLSQTLSLVLVASLASACSGHPTQRRTLAEAEAALAQGRAEFFKAEYSRASTACLRGLEAIGGNYADLSVVDDTGQHLVMAATLPPENAARVRCDTLATRIALAMARGQ